LDRNEITSSEIQKDYRLIIMGFQEKLNALFLTEEEIPVQFKLAQEVHQRVYLSNGEMLALEWRCAYRTLTYMCIKTGDGLKRKVIGTYPLCDAKKKLRLRWMLRLPPTTMAGANGLP
jgi:hypothetical protein